MNDLIKQLKETLDKSGVRFQESQIEKLLIAFFEHVLPQYGFNDKEKYCAFFAYEAFLATLPDMIKQFEDKIPDVQFNKDNIINIRDYMS